MNDQPTSFSDDELSAALDGEVDAELQARIDASPTASARSAELAAAAAHLTSADVSPLGASVVDDLIATALDAPVAPAAPRRPNTHRGPAPWLVAAGVIVLMAFGLTLIWAGRNAQDDQASAKFNTVGSSIGADGAEAESGASGGGSSGAADAPMSSASTTAAATSDESSRSGSSTDSTIPDPNVQALTAYALGTFADGDALRTWLAQPDGKGWTSTAADMSAGDRDEIPSDQAFDRCAQQLQVTLSLEDAAIMKGYATVADQPVVVYEFPTTSSKTGKPTTLVAAVGQTACDQVILFER